MIDPWTLQQLGEAIEKATEAKQRIEEAATDGEMIVGQLIEAAVLVLQQAWRVAHNE